MQIRFSPAIFVTILTVSAFAVSGLVITATEQDPAQAQVRRPLPKPSRGSRRFEQYQGKDASARLIAVGATRQLEGQARVLAPLEGIAFAPRPFFAWEASSRAKTHRFILYEGDAHANTSARVVYEKEVSTTEFVYPDDAPALGKGKLYSWRIVTPLAPDKKTVSAPVTFFVLTDEDSKEIREALAKAGLADAKTPQDRLKKARLFEEYGIWYDAFQVASALANDEPANEDALRYVDELIVTLSTESAP